MKSNEIRQRYLSFFGKRGHQQVQSASLVPHNDPTLFFVNAGMVPFKDVFTGVERKAYTRATSVQKCLRVSGKHNDLENVGRTPRHHTLFEMMGNFSFGDYFKPEAIAMAWEFLTGELSLEPKRLWVSVYEEDDEAYDLWRSLGFPQERLQRLDAKENFWSMGDTGPCGPCSEIHFDHGPRVSSDTRGPAGGDDRYVEIWNLVFMQYEQHADGSRLALPRPSIDTGSGLERVAAAMQNVDSNYDTDLFQGILQRTSQLAGHRYGHAEETDVAMRVIADHARATAFLIGDGVMPSNEARGYVLRRIMRRAIRFGVKVGLDSHFLHEVVDQVISDFEAPYPELAERRSFIDEVVQGEETRFRSTLQRGMRLLETELERAGKGGTVPGDVAFTLSDTYGFPLDLTRLIADEKGVLIDEKAFQEAMEAQRARGRAAWKGSGEQSVEALWPQMAEEFGHTLFSGYPTDSTNGTTGVGTVMGLVRRTSQEDGQASQRCEQLEAGEEGLIVLDRTPFYGEAGGQIGDSGTLSSSTASFQVTDTLRSAGLIIHVGRAEGRIALGEHVDAEVNPTRRDAIRRNHTATHLLHASLQSLLGEHVTQKGSLVAPDRLRFDFSHHKAVTQDELHAIEDSVNTQILTNLPLDTQVMELEAAKSAGAMALFGEKYEDLVRVVNVPGFSVELCGGTHVERTGSIGPFVITSESGIAAGVRRIEAQTGTGALSWVRGQMTALGEASNRLKTPPSGLTTAIQRLQDDRKSLEKELDAVRKDLAKAAAGDLLGQAKEIDGVAVLAARFDGDLKEQADRLRDQLGTSLVVLATQKGPKAMLVAAVTKDIAGKRAHAGEIIRAIAPLIQGGGGGRPDMAQAGGKDPSGIDAALEKVYEVAQAMLSQ